MALSQAGPGAAQPEMWRDIITTCFRPTVSLALAGASAAGVRHNWQFDSRAHSAYVQPSSMLP